MKFSLATFILVLLILHIHLCAVFSFPSSKKKKSSLREKFFVPESIDQAAIFQEALDDITFEPSVAPSEDPTLLPSATPSVTPSSAIPSVSCVPTVSPTIGPSKVPTAKPSGPTNHPSYGKLLYCEASLFYCHQRLLCLQIS